MRHMAPEGLQSLPGISIGVEGAQNTLIINLNRGQPVFALYVGAVEKTVLALTSTTGDGARP